MSKTTVLTEQKTLENWFTGGVASECPPTSGHLVESVKEAQRVVWQCLGYCVWFNSEGIGYSAGQVGDLPLWIDPLNQPESIYDWEELK